MNIVKNNFADLKRKLIVYWPIIIMAILFLVILMLINRQLIGPSVFGDETDYRRMINSVLVNHNLAGFTQYGPLYPLLTAIGSYLFQPHNIYNFTTGSNIFFAFLSFFPFWLLSKKLLPGFRYFWLPSVVFILAPFWTFTMVTWGDPLFYSLLYYSFYAIYRATQEKANYREFCVLGFILGLLFLVKPAGIFYFIALIMSFVIIFNKHILYNKIIRFNFLSFIFIAAILILPWIYRNIFIAHISPLGYGYVSSDLKEFIQTHSASAIIFSLIKCLGIHISYLIIATLGAIVFVFYFTYRLWNVISLSNKILILYLFFSLGLICSISTVHMVIVPVLGDWVPNGRYLTQFTPIFILLIFFYFQHYKMQLCTKVNIWLSIIMLLLVFFATPLFALGAFMVPNSPDLAMYFLLINGNGLPGVLHYFPSFSERLLPCLFILIVIVPVLTMGWKKNSLVIKIAVVCGLIYFMITLFHQSRLLRDMDKSQAPANELFVNAINTSFDICAANIYFNKTINQIQFGFIYTYWCPNSKIQFLSSTEVCVLAKQNTFLQNKGLYFITSSSANLHQYSVIDKNNSFALVAVNKKTCSVQG